MKFIDKISQGFSYDESQVLGYSEEELIKIERLYDIKLQGDFRQFMLEMGRSDGGLIGCDPIILYSTKWRMRDYILLQLGLSEALQEMEQNECFEGKAFVFSIEHEYWECFLRIDADNLSSIQATHDGVKALGDDANRVYYHDTSGGSIEDSGMSFLEYMQALVRKVGGNGIASRGDLLMI